LKKERIKLKRKVRDLNEKIGQLKSRLKKNQEDWALSFKELEYQQPVSVTSGVLKTTLCFPMPLYFAGYEVVQFDDNTSELFTTNGSCKVNWSVLLWVITHDLQQIWKKCIYLLETQTCADDVRDEPPQVQQTTKILEIEKLEGQEEEDEMEEEIGKHNDRNENEDPSWTPMEADAAYKRENDDDSEEINKPR